MKNILRIGLKVKNILLNALEVKNIWLKPLKVKNIFGKLLWGQISTLPAAMTLSTQRNLKTKEIMMEIKICVNNEYVSIIPITVVITKEKNEGYLAKRITLRSGNPGVKHQVAILESWLDTFVPHLIQIWNSHHSTWNLSHSTKGAIFLRGECSV